MDREELIIKLTRLDFARFDLRLYLNTHLADKKAIMDYNILTAEADGLRAEFDRLFGPLSHRDASPDQCFNWIDNPWPWERDFIGDCSHMDDRDCGILENSDCTQKYCDPNCANKCYDSMEATCKRGISGQGSNCTGKRR